MVIKYANYHSPSKTSAPLIIIQPYLSKIECHTHDAIRYKLYTTEVLPRLRCLFAQPPHVCVITSVVCSLSIYMYMYMYFVTSFRTMASKYNIEKWEPGDQAKQTFCAGRAS